MSGRHSTASNQYGYTLLELMVAIVISSLIFIGIMTFLVTSLVNNSVRSSRADLLREAQLALDVMVKDIRLSATAADNNSIVDDNSPNAASTSGLGWESSASTLVLNSAVEDSDGDLIFADATHFITEKNNIIYYVQDNTLYKRTLANDVTNNTAVTSCPPDEATNACPADRLSVKDVESLQFRYYNSDNVEVDPSDARSIEVSLTLHAVKFGRDVEVTYSTRTVFRNN